MVVIMPAGSAPGVRVGWVVRIHLVRAVVIGTLQCSTFHVKRMTLKPLSSTLLDFSVLPVRIRSVIGSQSSVKASKLPEVYSDIGALYVTTCMYVGVI